MGIKSSEKSVELDEDTLIRWLKGGDNGGNKMGDSKLLGLVSFCRSEAAKPLRTRPVSQSKWEQNPMKNHLYLHASHKIRYLKLRRDSPHSSDAPGLHLKRHSLNKSRLC